jgi:hypothetical protein
MARTHSTVRGRLCTLFGSGWGMVAQSPIVIPSCDDSSASNRIGLGNFLNPGHPCPVHIGLLSTMDRAQIWEDGISLPHTLKSLISERL